MILPMIPSLIVPLTNREILSAVETIYKNSRETISEFEQKFSRFVGCKYSIAVHSGTATLYVLLKSHSLDKNDEIIVPAYTCESVPRLLIGMGLKIKFVDVDKETYNLSIEELQSKITKNTKAILAVHMFGNPCEMKDIKEIAEDYNAVVIEDAAQSIGAEYHGKKIGTIGDSGFFSLGKGKPITTINGGVITTNDKETADKCREIIRNFNVFDVRRKFGVFVNLLTYYPLKNPLFYGLIYKTILHRRIERRNKLKNCMNLDDFKFKYTGMQASMGLIQLSRLDDFNEARINNTKFLMNHLKNISRMRLPERPKHSMPIFLRLPVWIDNVNENGLNDLISSLERAGIDAPAAYPNSLPKFFFNSKGYPNSEELSKKTIVLPVHPAVKESGLISMAKIVDRWANENLG